MAAKKKEMKNKEILTPEPAKPQSPALKKLKLAFGIIGILIVIAHMTYFAFKPYDLIYFFLGFGVIYLVFVLPLKWLNKA